MTEFVIHSLFKRHGVLNDKKAKRGRGRAVVEYFLQQNPTAPHLTR